jgi:hypothetical protein
MLLTTTTTRDPTITINQTKVESHTQQQTLPSGTRERVSTLDIDQKRTTISGSSDVVVAADSIGATVVAENRRSVRTDRFWLSLSSLVHERRDGSTFSEVLFRALSSTRERTTSTTTTTNIDHHQIAPGIGLALIHEPHEIEQREKVTTHRSEVSGSIVTETPAFEAQIAQALASLKAKLAELKQDAPPATKSIEQHLREVLAPTTQEVVGRFEAAKKSGDQTMIDAYRPLVTILTTQKKKMWAQALYGDVKTFLEGRGDNAYTKTLGKLDHAQLIQFLGDVRHALYSTKGFASHAEKLSDLQVASQLSQLKAA